ncbi:hypothetical protein CkaCkLH20_01988 [Colletotrichum karsti]|uniref:Uncharacterized protein n=1 Tax=Colletotrichum karsti TaxID=1095194 RepID=A0A9P6IFG7_9PEZI|nr:uncharacterized protein CkaCkLH20_01988 [Colletotrichum karsti]KAF9880946.1 hypothetical protein CkaCkLH20_01988 [Colletotrichum karsti]
MSSSTPSGGQKRRREEPEHLGSSIAVDTEESSSSAIDYNLLATTLVANNLLATPSESSPMTLQRSSEQHQPSQLSPFPPFPVDFSDLNPEAQRRYLISVCRVLAANGPATATDRAAYPNDASIQTLDSLFATLYTTAEAIELLTRDM